MERIEKAILLGCARKYLAWRNNQAHGPIRSLRYFESVVGELEQQNFRPEYWDYIRSRLAQMETLWISTHGQPEGLRNTMPQGDLQFGKAEKLA